MGGNVSQGMLLAALCSLNGLGSSFVPSQQVLFGGTKCTNHWVSDWRESFRKRSWVRVRKTSASTSTARGPRQAGGVRMDAINTGTDIAETSNPLSSSSPVPSAPFSNTDTG